MSTNVEQGQLPNKVNNLTEDDTSVISWVLWSSSPSETRDIHGAVDKIFSGFSFYPEIEWRKFGYPPPDGCKVLGAWRHPNSLAFVFFMDNPGMKSPTGSVQHILSFDGQKAILSPLLPQIQKLKDELFRKNGRRRNEVQLAARLDRANTARSLRGLLALMAPITAAINGLALYLHKLPSPVIEARWLANIYGVLLPLVFISALGLLFAFTIICTLYICKYGFLLLRRL